jgi:arylsulfatase A-like enzyme
MCAVGLLVAALSSCRVEVEDPPAASERPSVLLVVLDTVRADRVSSYGYRRPTTPQLDAVAAAGVLFEDVSAPAPWTWPSHASLFTGEPPWVHGAHLVLERDDASSILGMSVSPMRGDLPTLAERFGASGYRSVASVANDWLGPELGLMRGFDSVEVFGTDAGVVGRALSPPLAALP